MLVVALDGDPTGRSVPLLVSGPVVFGRPSATLHLPFVSFNDFVNQIDFGPGLAHS